MAGPRKDRHHERHLRSRAAVDAEGRRCEVSVAAEVTIIETGSIKRARHSPPLLPETVHKQWSFRFGPLGTSRV